MTVISKIAGKPLDAPAEVSSVRRIALVLAGLSAGGAERVASLLSAAWLAQGLQVTIITFDCAAETSFHGFAPGVRFLRLGLPSARSGRCAALLHSGRRVFALRRALRGLDPDMTVSFLTKINVLALLACLGTRRKLIVSERNNPLLQPKSAIWNALFRCLSWRAAGIVMQTRASLDCLHPGALRRARVIANPVELGPIARSESSAPVLAAVGRLTRQKGFDMLIAAFARIADHHRDWTLVIWGEGEDRAALERQIAAAGLAGRILLPGAIGRPEAWVAAASAFVLSSRYEGFPNVVAEAMAGGLPVAAFDCDFGPADMIDHDRNGLLVPRNDVAALAAALDRLMGDPVLRSRLGDAARAIARRCDTSAIAARWHGLMSEIVAS